MSVTRTGRQLGAYRILSLLGSGGMGEVYRAHDTTLGRDVAIKILPPHFASDPDRRARFEREARLLAALNHPHIGAIYGFEDASTDSDDAGARALILELVEGPTLADWISHGRPSMRDALAVACQIADALEAAHEKGIVHRDLKPANIIVQGRGLSPGGESKISVKVLDFGLAKAIEAEGVTADLGLPGGLPTMTWDVTQQGVVFGTPAYMSPEQARGKATDKRTDIWAFGCVLYEMITGRRAFAGPTVSDTIAAVLEREPDWAALPVTTPAAIRRLLERCLRKDPARRLHDAADARVDVEDALEAKTRPEEISTASDRRLESSLPLAQGVVRIRRRRRALLTAVAFSLLAAGAWWARPHSSVKAPPPEVVKLTNFPGDEEFPTFSPNGDRVAFAWNGPKGDNWDIWVKQVDQTNAATPQQITTDPAEDSVPAWSPDGAQIAYVRLAGSQAAIYLTSPTGGNGRRLAFFETTTDGWRPSGDMRTTLSWSPHGDWLAVAELDADRSSHIVLISTGTGDRRTLIGPVKDVTYAHPTFSPRGNSLAYSQCSPGRNDCEVYLVPLDANLTPGSSRRLTLQRAMVDGIAWATDGQSLVYGQRQHLWEVHVDATSEPLAPTAVEGGFPAIAGNALAYMTYGKQGDMLKLTPHSDASPEPFLSSTDWDHGPAFSPDGRWMAFSSDRSGETEIWVASLDGKTEYPLTTDKDLHPGSPQWSWDSHWIAFDALGDDGRQHVFVMDHAGGQKTRLTDDAFGESLPTWSRNDQWVYFSSNQTGRKEIWRAQWPLHPGGRSQRMTDAGGLIAWESWDGQSLYYDRVSGGPLFTRAVAGGSDTQVLASVSGWQFFPAKSGIYYLVHADPQYPNKLLLRFHGSSGPDTVLNRFDLLAEAGGVGLSVSPDETFVVVSGVPTSAGNDLRLIRHFR